MSEPPMPPGPPRQPLPQPQGQPLPQQPWPQYQQPPDGPVPVQHPPKKPKRFGWPPVIITAIAGHSLGGIVGGIVGGSGDETATTAEPTAAVTATETVTASETADTATSKAPTAKKTTQPEPEITMGEGTSEIGVDAVPGRYKTRVPEDSYCYWERLKDNGGGSDSIIAGYVDSGARASVTVKRGEFFTSEDCGTWTKV
jgi:outer membrane biosynthesis protein TonB